MDFITFKQTLIEHLPEETDIYIGNDFSINYHILVDEDGSLYTNKTILPYHNAPTLWYGNYFCRYIFVDHVNAMWYL